MKTFLLILILFAFLQSAFLTLNLVLVAIIARSLAIEQRSNLFLAFFGGLVLSFLTQVNLGYWPLVLILVVKLVSLLKKLPVSLNPLMVFLYGSLLVSFTASLNKFFINPGFEFLPNILETFLVIPFFYAALVWEDRFIVKRSIKLKI